MAGVAHDVGGKTAAQPAQGFPTRTPDRVRPHQTRYFTLRGGCMIRLEGIGKQNGRQIVFIDASATLQKGEKVGLVGPNGAGKTTLFRMITGEERRMRVRWRSIAA